MIAGAACAFSPMTTGRLIARMKGVQAMTDNRTTKLLHKLLDERGVEYETDVDECCDDEQPSTTWDFNLCGLEMTVTTKEFVDIDGKTYLEMDFHHAFTPEQAIAATLGNSTLTAEHVREAIFNNSSYASYDGVRYYADGINMQAVADELNTRIEQTCNLIEDGNLLHCSNCGGAAEKQLWTYWNYCPNCRAKVIK